MKPRAPLRNSILLGLLFWVGGVSCTSPVDFGNSTVPPQCTDQAPQIAAVKTDILFVVDNSESMADKQAAVARELPAFVAQLQQGSGVQQDFQIGLVTTSVYQNALFQGSLYFQTYPSQSGRLQPVPDALPDGGVNLGTGTERILTSSDPNLVDKFSRLVRVGISGSGQETPFEATRLAVTDLANVPIADGGNQGFLRDGAQLLIVTVMDEDDCSEMDRPVQVYVAPDKNRAPNYNDYCTQQSAKLTPVDTYHQIFESLTDGTGAQRSVIWADIGPVSLADKTAQSIIDPDGGTLRNVDCPVSFGAGFRHRAMAVLFDPSDPTLSDLDSICDASFHDALINIAALATAVQQIDISNVPDPALLEVSIWRANGNKDECTVANGGITFETLASGGGRIHFHGACQRRADDTNLVVNLICAG